MLFHITLNLKIEIYRIFAHTHKAELGSELTAVDDDDSVVA